MFFCHAMGSWKSCQGWHCTVAFHDRGPLVPLDSLSLYCQTDYIDTSIAEAIKATHCLFRYNDGLLCSLRRVEDLAQRMYLFIPCLLFSISRLLSRVMNSGSQLVMEGVKNLVLKQQVSGLLGRLYFDKCKLQSHSPPMRM